MLCQRFTLRRQRAAIASTPTMGTGAVLWLAVWVGMILAIMFPTAVPMNLMFAEVTASTRQRDQPFAPTCGRALCCSCPRPTGWQTQEARCPLGGDGPAAL